MPILSIDALLQCQRGRAVRASSRLSTLATMYSPLGEHPMPEGVPAAPAVEHRLPGRLAIDMDQEDNASPGQSPAA